MMQGLRGMGLKGMGLSKSTQAWLQRVAWLKQHGPTEECAQLADLTEQALSDGDAAAWLQSFVTGARSQADLQKLAWGDILR